MAGPDHEVSLELHEQLHAAEMGLAAARAETNSTAQKLAEAQQQISVLQPQLKVL